jgi:PASTA domain
MDLTRAIPLIASLAVIFGVARVADALAPDLRDGFFSRERVVPALIHRPITAAKEEAVAAGLDVVVSQGDLGAKQPKDLVLAQSPAPGARLRPGQPIRLTVSPGILPPNVVGKTVDQARAELLLAGWSAAPELERRAVPNASPNVVLDQRPGPDELAPDKGPVTLVVPAASLTGGRLTRMSDGGTAADAVDGKLETAVWPATGPPSWVEVRLASPSTVGVVNLVAATTEDLLVTVELWAWDTRGRFFPLHLFTTGVTDGATLSAQLDAPAQEVVSLRIVTTETTGSLGWREIEALAP